MNKNCLFCKIIKKEIQATIVYESDNILAFKDIDPKAPVHILIIPKKHIPNILEFKSNDDKLLPEITKAIQTIATKHHLSENGFRIVTNIGEDGGQTVQHLHFHMLGGRSLKWPPG